jgi:hypothetical protein
VNGDKADSKRSQWMSRLAQAGFWFFLIKGLLWLLVPATAAWFGFDFLAH